jgi:general secretion pathway protein M
MATLERSNNRQTAILLLVIVVLLTYLLVFHWFILRHVEFGAEISTLSEQLVRYQRVAGQRQMFEEQLVSLQATRSDDSLFLDEADFNEAAAGMSERLGQMINTQAENDCQIVSRQPVRPRIQERFTRVTVNVRMNCNVDDLLKIQYWLETSIPMILVDELTVIKQRARRSRRNQAVQEQGKLDIRFNMSGYLRQ